MNLITRERRSWPTIFDIFRAQSKHAARSDFRRTLVPRNEIRARVHQPNRSMWAAGLPALVGGTRRAHGHSRRRRFSKKLTRKVYTVCTCYTHFFTVEPSGVRVSGDRRRSKTTQLRRAVQIGELNLQLHSVLATNYFFYRITKSESVKIGIHFFFFLVKVRIHSIVIQNALFLMTILYYGCCSNFLRTTYHNR